MPTGISPERQKGIPLTKAALALTPLTIGVLSACSNNPAVKPPEGVTPIATDTATAIIPMTPAHAPSIIPASPAITVEVSPLPPSKATETITATVPVITPTVGTPLPIPGTPFAIPSSTETKPTATVTKTVIPTATKEATATPTRSPEEIRKEAHELSIKLTTGEYAAVPADLDPARREAIRAAIEQALIIYPYGITGEELNQDIFNKSGKDFRKYINDTYGKYGIDYDTIIKQLNINHMEDLFSGINIDPNHYSGPTTSWQPGKDTIFIAPEDFNPNSNSYPLYASLIKESVANKVSDNATTIRLAKIEEALAKGKPIPSPAQLIGGYSQVSFGESISFAIQFYVYPQATFLENMFLGGIHVKP